MEDILLKYFYLSFFLFGSLYCEESKAFRKDVFREELFISPLNSGHVYLHFQFTIETPLRAKYAHMDYFPKPVIDTLQKHHVKELHVRLTQGVFRHQKWGYPLLSAPTGGEVWAWFDEDSPSVTENWRGLTNSLAGMLCATFNDVSSVNSIIPQWNFYPEGLRGSEAVNTSYLRYSMLPGENLCTENLTPWKKLLPCYDRAGLSKLLNAVKLLSAHYFSLAFSVKPVCANKDCSQHSLQMQVFATAVVLPGSIEDADKPNWSLRDLLEVPLDSGCPLASDSLIYVNQSKKDRMVFYPLPSYTISTQEEITAVYDLRDNKIWTNNNHDIGGKSVYRADYSLNHQPIITAHRYVSGVGQQSGGIRCSITNHHPESAVTVSYLEIIPWFLRVYFHTIRLTTSDGLDIPIIKKHFHLGRDRLFPHHVELVFNIPAMSSVEFSIEFDYTLLKWTEYKPDANRGSTIPSAVINAKLDRCEDFQFPKNFTVLRSTGTQCFLRLYTEALVVNLPTPDFSMPYNVICMTCTVLALAFGPIHAITTKRFTLYDPEKNPPPLGKIKMKIQEKLAKIKNRFSKSKPKTE